MPDMQIFLRRRLTSRTVGTVRLPPRHPKNLGIVLASDLFGKPKGRCSNHPKGSRYSITLTRSQLQPTAWSLADPHTGGPDRALFTPTTWSSY
jgi:hypothetical protein